MTIIARNIVSSAALSALLLLAGTGVAAAADYDIVISGGRVMDPESGFDKVANVGVKDGRVVTISDTKLSGKVELDAAGKVVAPGFIDLHAHGQHDVGQQYQVRDGVTTAIDAEGGAMPMAPYFKALEGKSLINFGASASQRCARVQVFTGRPCGGNPASNPEASATWKFVLSERRDAMTSPATEAQTQAEIGLMRQAVRDGAVGFALGIEYTPGAGRAEIYDMFKAAAAIKAPVFVHVRQRQPDAAPGVPIAVAQEVIADAAVTGARLHIAHIHSTGLGDTPTLIDMVTKAQARGLDIDTEAYPYTAGSTMLGSEFFGEGWQKRSNISYKDVQWPETGERLTEESFNAYRKQYPNRTVIVHMIPEASVDAAIANPNVLIASDGQAWVTSGEHPRGAGTFSRVLGHYVRERKALDLMAALRKMTILPARRLEEIAPVMKNKGRLREGSDADITIFDPARIIDRATYEKPMQPSDGISYVLVGGQLVVRDGKIVQGLFPGKPIRSQTLPD
ncbi:amidohydrolase family protein [Sphingosinicella rhizophila]|uniref:Amidohydrolase family protein n=1 Tax=Sphingosinicella rhizophila TaxID=3050082 RepID=A0ABU3QAK3_9SPHN|nr:amidohydrolase family protein [Sphingosinicella sp. GR2756]MDT9600357.1 amidohydrolase family protein [Sphingosinicella sp. GR2756]